MVTVKKLLKIPKLKELEVVAGHQGLERNVGHVTVMEVPDIIQWLKGDDFVITSLYSMKDDIHKQCQLVRDLALASSACMAVKVGQYVKDIPQELKDVAEQLNFPLIKIPYHLAYIDLIVNIMNNVFEEKNPRIILEKYIKDIIFETYTNEDLMLERGNMLGLAIDKKQYLAMTLQFPEHCKPTEAELSTLWRVGVSVAQNASSRIGMEHCIAVNTSSNSFILLDSDSEKTIFSMLPFIEQEALNQLNYYFPNQTIYIGYGKPNNGLEGIRDTYIDSLKASQTGQLFYPDNKVFHYSDMETHCLMVEVVRNKKGLLFEDILSKIDSHEISETLITYFENDNSIDLTAAKLFAHKNTIKYRLQRVKELTGLDVKNFNDSMKLYLAVVARKVNLFQNRK